MDLQHSKFNNGGGNNGKKMTEGVPGRTRVYPKHAKRKPAASENDMKKLIGLHILLADDMVINAMIVRNILEEKGCFVDTAGDGSEALYRFSVSPNGYYDLIITDIVMPVMDGFEEIRRIRALERPDAKSIPIITLSAYLSTYVQSAAMQEDIGARLLKPTKPDDLYESIIKLLDAK